MSPVDTRKQQRRQKAKLRVYCYFPILSHETSTPIQLPGRIQGGMHPASTFSTEFAALVICVGSTRSARRLKSLLFAKAW